MFCKGVGRLTLSLTARGHHILLVLAVDHVSPMTVGISCLLGAHGTQILLVVRLYSSTSEPFENIACYCVGVGHMMAY